MFCPNCSQKQISNEIRFCSRCGFPMSGVAHLLESGGAIMSEGDSPRKRGLKQGLLIFLLSFLIVPILTVISILIRTETPAAVIIAAILFGGGGLLRMIYAFLAESNNSDRKIQHVSGENRVTGEVQPRKISEGEQIPASEYLRPETRNWRDTNDFSPPSVTEKTTNLLKNS
ncbi:MAG: zinc ribbon domain-containing protein [Pyrinomonadaceae bacterium]|nr:zinc ribbon domain-containing protein [Pyrinomonadaceae bacterium]